VIIWSVYEAIVLIWSKIEIQSLDSKEWGLSPDTFKRQAQGYPPLALSTWVTNPHVRLGSIETIDELRFTY